LACTVTWVRYVHIKGLLVNMNRQTVAVVGWECNNQEQRAKIREKNNVGSIAHIIFMNFGDLTCCCLIIYNESRGG
jgi:hypothetical protein